MTHEKLVESILIAHGALALAAWGAYARFADKHVVIRVSHDSIVKTAKIWPDRLPC